MINSSSESPEAFMNTLRLYKDGTGLNDLINNLGMMDGRIVKLTKQPAKQREALKDTFITQVQRIKPGIETNTKQTVKDFYKLLSSYHISNSTTQEIKLDKKIREQLEKIKEGNIKAFKYIEENANIGFYNRDNGYLALMRMDKHGDSFFESEISPTRWKLSNNTKSDEIIKNKFCFMNQIFAYQYEKTIEHAGWLMTLPEDIQQSNIINDYTDSLIIKHMGKHDTEEFKIAFLTTTVNGKSTARIAKDFGLKIGKLEVTPGNTPRGFSPGTPPVYFTVTCHVSPDPEVYGKPQ